MLNAKRGQKVLNPTTQHNITDIKYMGQVFGSFLGGTWNERYKKKPTEIGKRKCMQHRILQSLGKDT